MSRRLLRLCGCLLLLLALGTNSISFKQPSAAHASGSLPTSGPSSTPTSVTTSTTSPTNTPTAIPTATTPQETCTRQTAVWTNDQWGGHYFIYWPANWETVEETPWHLRGNFNGSRYRIVNRHASDTVYMWALTAAGYQTQSNPGSGGTDWRTITFDTITILFGTDAFLGAQTFELEFCTSNPPINSTVPGLERCYSTDTIFDNDEWGGHQIAPWPNDWPYNINNKRLLLGNYQNAKFRVTNYRPVDDEPVRLWFDTSGGTKPFVVRDTNWHTIIEVTRFITFVSHIPEGGGPFHLEICFPYKKAERNEYDISQTPEGNSQVLKALDIWRNSRFGESKVKIEDFITTSTVPPGQAPADMDTTLVRPKYLIHKSAFWQIEYAPQSDLITKVRIVDIFNVSFGLGIEPPPEGFICARREVYNYGSSNQCVDIARKEEPSQDIILYGIRHSVIARAFGPGVNLDKVEAAARPLPDQPISQDVVRGNFTPTSLMVDPVGCFRIELAPSFGISFGEGLVGSVGFSTAFPIEVCPTTNIDYDTHPKGLIVTWTRPFPVIVHDTPKEASHTLGQLLLNAGSHQSQNVGWEFTSVVEMSP